MSDEIRLLLIAFYFPPAGGGGVQRPLGLARWLSPLGVVTHVLAPTDPKWIHRDPGLVLPAQASVHRAPFLGPRGRLPAEELQGRSGVDLLLRRARLLPRRLLIPDEDLPWLATAVPAALRLIEEHAIDVVVTTSPPSSIHLIGAWLQWRSGVAWVADLRDSVVAKPDRRFERLAVRAKEQMHRRVAELVARRADAVVGVTGTIVQEMVQLGARGRLAVIPNGADLEAFANLAYESGELFRVTHTGSFFGQRDPRPFLRALARSQPDVLGRFVGDFRRRDREVADRLRLGERLELHPFRPHRETLSMQRNSEALLLLLPDEGGRGLDVPSGKIFEYLAARRPIIAAVPEQGAAARLVQEAHAGIVVDSENEDGILSAVEAFREEWEAGTLRVPTLPETLRRRIDGRERAREYAELLRVVLAP